jgi:hypothetical protein
VSQGGFLAPGTELEDSVKTYLDLELSPAVVALVQRGRQTADLDPATNITTAASPLVIFCASLSLADNGQVLIT